MSKLYLESGTYIVELEGYDGSSITNMRVAETSAPNTWYSFGSVALESPNPQWDSAYIGTHDHKFVGFGANEAPWTGNNFIIFTPTGLAAGQSITTDSLLLSSDWGSLYHQTGLVATDVKSELIVTPTPETTLVGHWSFDNGDATADVGSDGTNSGATFVTDAGRTVAAFEHGDYIQIDNAGADFTTEDFTAAFWFYNDGASGDFGNLIGNLDTGSYGWGITRYWGNDTLFTVQSGNGGSWSNPSHPSQFTIPLNTWTHVVLVRSGTQFKIYLDGVDSGYTATAHAAIVYTGDFLRIATHAYSPNETGIGKYDDVRIYSMALDASQISDLYNATIVTPVSDPTISIASSTTPIDLASEIVPTIQLNGNSLDAPGNGAVFVWQWNYDINSDQVGVAWNQFDSGDTPFNLEPTPNYMSGVSFRAGIKVNGVYYYSNEIVMPADLTPTIVIDNDPASLSPGDTITVTMDLKGAVVGNFSWYSNSDWVGDDPSGYVIAASDNQKVITAEMQLHRSGDIYDGMGTYTANITIADSEAPVITILGDDPITLEPGDEFIDPGATATDNFDGSVTVFSTGAPLNLTDDWIQVPAYPTMPTFNGDGSLSFQSDTHVMVRKENNVPTGVDFEIIVEFDNNNTGSGDFGMTLINGSDLIAFRQQQYNAWGASNSFFFGLWDGSSYLTSGAGPAQLSSGAMKLTREGSVYKFFSSSDKVNFTEMGQADASAVGWSPAGDLELRVSAGQRTVDVTGFSRSDITSGAQEGSYTITYTATDAAGNTAQSTRQVSVSSSSNSNENTNNIGDNNMSLNTNLNWTQLRFAEQSGSAPSIAVDGGIAYVRLMVRDRLNGIDVPFKWSEFIAARADQGQTGMPTGISFDLPDPANPGSTKYGISSELLLDGSDARTSVPTEEVTGSGEFKGIPLDQWIPVQDPAGNELTLNDGFLYDDSTSNGGVYVVDQNEWPQQYVYVPQNRVTNMLVEEIYASNTDYSNSHALIKVSFDGGDTYVLPNYADSSVDEFDALRSVLGSPDAPGLQVIVKDSSGTDQYIHIIPGNSPLWGNTGVKIATNFDLTTTFGIQNAMPEKVDLSAEDVNIMRSWEIDATAPNSILNVMTAGSPPEWMPYLEWNNQLQWFAEGGMLGLAASFGGVPSYYTRADLLRIIPVGGELSLNLTEFSMNPVTSVTITRAQIESATGHSAYGANYIEFIGGPFNDDQTSALLDSSIYTQFGATGQIGPISAFSEFTLEVDPGNWPSRSLYPTGYEAISISNNAMLAALDSDGDGTVDTELVIKDSGGQVIYQATVAELQAHATWVASNSWAETASFSDYIKIDGDPANSNLPELGSFTSGNITFDSTAPSAFTLSGLVFDGVTASAGAGSYAGVNAGADYPLSQMMEEYHLDDDGSTLKKLAITQIKTRLHSQSVEAFKPRTIANGLQPVDFISQLKQTTILEAKDGNGPTGMQIISQSEYDLLVLSEAQGGFGYADGDLLPEIALPIMEDAYRAAMARLSDFSEGTYFDAASPVFTADSSMGPAIGGTFQIAEDLSAAGELSVYANASVAGELDGQAGIGLDAGADMSVSQHMYAGSDRLNHLLDINGATQSRIGDNPLTVPLQLGPSAYGADPDNGYAADADAWQVQIMHMARLTATEQAGMVVEMFINGASQGTSTVVPATNPSYYGLDVNILSITHTTAANHPDFGAVAFAADDVVTFEVDGVAVNGQYVFDPSMPATPYAMGPSALMIDAASMSDYIAVGNAANPGDLAVSDPASSSSFAENVMVQSDLLLVGDTAAVVFADDTPLNAPDGSRPTRVGGNASQTDAASTVTLSGPAVAGEDAVGKLSTVQAVDLTVGDPNARPIATFEKNAQFDNTFDVLASDEIDIVSSVADVDKANGDVAIVIKADDPSGSVLIDGDQGVIFKSDPSDDSASTVIEDQVDVIGNITIEIPAASASGHEAFRLESDGKSKVTITADASGTKADMVINNNVAQSPPGGLLTVDGAMQVAGNTYISSNPDQFIVNAQVESSFEDNVLELSFESDNLTYQELVDFAIKTEAEAYALAVTNGDVQGDAASWSELTDAERAGDSLVARTSSEEIPRVNASHDGADGVQLWGPSTGGLDAYADDADFLSREINLDPMSMVVRPNHGDSDVSGSEEVFSFLRGAGDLDQADIEALYAAIHLGDLSLEDSIRIVGPDADALPRPEWKDVLLRMRRMMSTEVGNLTGQSTYAYLLEWLNNVPGTGMDAQPGALSESDLDAILLALHGRGSAPAAGSDSEDMYNYLTARDYDGPDLLAQLGKFMAVDAPLRKLVKSADPMVVNTSGDANAKLHVKDMSVGDDTSGFTDSSLAMKVENSSGAASDISGYLHMGTDPASVDILNLHDASGTQLETIRLKSDESMTFSQVSERLSFTGADSATFESIGVQHDVSLSGELRIDQTAIIEGEFQVYGKVGLAAAGSQTRVHGNILAEKPVEMKDDIQISTSLMNGAVTEVPAEFEPQDPMPWDLIDGSLGSNRRLDESATAHFELRKFDRNDGNGDVIADMHLKGNLAADSLLAGSDIWFGQENHKDMLKSKAQFIMQDAWTDGTVANATYALNGAADDVLYGYTLSADSATLTSLIRNGVDVLHELTWQEAIDAGHATSGDADYAIALTEWQQANPGEDEAAFLAAGTMSKHSLLSIASTLSAAMEATGGSTVIERLAQFYGTADQIELADAFFAMPSTDSGGNAYAEGDFIDATQAAAIKLKLEVFHNGLRLSDSEFDLVYSSSAAGKKINLRRPAERRDTLVIDTKVPNPG